MVIAKQNLNFMAVKGESFSGVALGADFAVSGGKFFFVRKKKGKVVVWVSK